MMPFYCRSCFEKEVNLATLEPSGPPAEAESESEQEYDIEELVDCKVVNINDPSDRDWLVKWKGYESSENTWIPEKDLDKCGSLISKFIEAHPDRKLVPTKHPTDLNGSAGININVRNWMSSQNILDLTKRQLKTDLHVELYESLKSINSIYLLSQNNHMYVILFDKSTQTYYIADGDNKYIRDQYERALIEEKLRVKLTPIRTIGQSMVDHCGSSAIAIAEAFEQMLINNLKYDIIVIRGRSLNRIKKRAHPERSQTVSPYIIKTIVRKCLYLGCLWKIKESKNAKQKRITPEPINKKRPVGRL